MQPLRALPLAVANFGWLAVFNHAMALIALILIPAEFALASAFSASLRTAFLRAREASALGQKALCYRQLPLQARELEARVHELPLLRR